MKLPPVEISVGERAELELRVRSNTVEARVAQRARIVLLAADGLSNIAVANKVDVNQATVVKWRKRFLHLAALGRVVLL